MKRILCAVLALVMIAGFAGCNRETAETEPILESSEEFTEETIEETEEETEEPTEEETEEESTEPTETTEETVPPCANHSWGYWVQLEAPTTSAEGKRVRTCTVCGTEDVQVIEKLPKPSSHKHKYKTETSKATCKEDGWVYYYCSCGDWYQVEEKATEHTWGDWKITKGATETTPGTRTRTCKKCKEKETENVYYCAKDDHSWGDWKFTKYATSAHPGEETRTCSICGGKETRTVPLCATGKHHYGDEQKKAPTCGAEGYYYKRCKTYGYGVKTKTIPATGNHKWSSWTLKDAATPTTTGTQERTCSVCKATETRAIPEHDCDFHITSSQPATCTEPGFEKKQCSICQKEISEDLPALGHDWGDWIVSEDDPTKEVRKCQRDGCSETETRDIQTTSTPEASDPDDSKEE